MLLNMRLFPWAWIAVLTVCAGCRCARPLPTPDIGPEPAFDDAGVALDDVRLACRHLRALGCPDGQPTPAGASCEEVMRASLPPVGGVDPKCIARAKTCDQEVTCTVP